jgi:hypothetical protein
MGTRSQRSLGGYLKGYRALVNEGRAVSSQGFDQFFRSLRENSSLLQESRRRNELRFAPHYNIFHVLPIERREAVLHSPMLAHLLDPSASHGQAHLFLRAFFEVAHANAHLTPPPEPLEVGWWSVRPEVYIGNGRLDIFIECPEKKYALVIENKIDAALEDTQLARYSRWLQERRSHYAKQLVFLTPTGRPPESRISVPCFPMSYRRDVLEILRCAIPKIKPPKVKELVRQYQAILNEWEEEEDEQPES